MNGASEGAAEHAGGNPQGGVVDSPTQNFTFLVDICGPGSGPKPAAKTAVKAADAGLTSAFGQALTGAITVPISAVVLLEDLLDASEVLDDFIHPQKLAAKLVEQVVTHVVTPVATAVAGPVAGPVVAVIAGQLAGELTEEVLGGDRQSATTADAVSALLQAYCVLDHQRSGIADLADNQSFVEFIGGLLAKPLEAVISVGGSDKARRDQERETDQPGWITVFLAVFEVVTAETAGSDRPVDPKAPLQPLSFAILRCLPARAA
jgi:hypothetical protein